MNTFQGFKPSGMEKIANAMGFQGNIKDFQQILQDNPDRQTEMMRYQDMARKMVEGGYVKKMSTGGGVDDRKGRILPIDPPKEEPKKPKKTTITDITAKRVTDPKMPTGAVVNPYGVPSETGQYIDPDKSKLGTTPTGTATTPTYASTATAYNPNPKYSFRDRPVFAFGDADPRAESADSRSGFFFREEAEARTYEADQKATQVDSVNKALEAAQTNPDDVRAKVNAQSATESLVGSLEAAEGKAHLINSPAKRELEAGEIVDPVANAEKASKFTEEVQAATATPSEKATVQGQLVLQDRLWFRQP